MGYSLFLSLSPTRWLSEEIHFIIVKMKSLFNVRAPYVRRWQELQRQNLSQKNNRDSLVILLPVQQRKKKDRKMHMRFYNICEIILLRLCAVWVCVRFWFDKLRKWLLWRNPCARDNSWDHLGGPEGGCIASCVAHSQRHHRRGNHSDGPTYHIAGSYKRVFGGSGSTHESFRCRRIALADVTPLPWYTTATICCALSPRI